MTKRTLWMIGIAVVLAILCVKLERVRQRPATPNDASEPDTRGRRATTSAPGLADVFAGRGGEPATGNEEEDPVRLEGIVQSIDSVPEAGFTVRLGNRTTVSDQDGSFAFDDVPPGEATITAEQGMRYGEVTRLIDGTSEPVEIEVRSGPTLTVHVVADATGRPVVGAKVETDDRVALTDASGTAVLRAIESTEEVVWVEAAGFANLRGQVIGDESKPTAPIETTVRLLSAAPVRGIVVGPTGEPIPEARVRLDTDEQMLTVYADAKGGWEFPHAPPGVLELSAAAEDYLRSKPIEVKHDGLHPIAGVKLVLEVGAELAGIVVDSDGNPVQGASLTGVRCEDTGPDGRFLAKGIEEGEIEISASEGDRMSNELVVKVTRAKRGEVRLVLQHTAISGIIVDQRGAPVEGATVYGTLGGSYSRMYSATADEHGRFSITGIQPGTYELRAQHEAERDRPLPQFDGTGVLARAGQSGVRVVLAPLGTIKGRVTVDGVPATYFGVSVAALTNGYGGNPTVVVETSEFIEKAIAAGQYKVTIAGPGFESWTRDVTLAAGATIDLGTIAVTRGRIVRGRVIDHAGRAIAGAAVTIGPSTAMWATSKVAQAMDGFATATSGANGAFELTGVPRDSSLEISAVAPTGRKTLEKTLQPGEAFADLVVPEIGVLEGRVTTTTTQRDSLFLYNGDNGFSEIVKLDFEGRFRLANIPVGTYELGLSGRSKEFIKVTIEANRTTSVEYTPPPGVETPREE